MSNIINNINDYCRIYGDTVESVFEEFNTLREFELDINMRTNNLPEFMVNILYDHAISPEGKKKFMTRFGLRYLEDDIFRKMTDGCCFLFIDNDYEGVYSSLESASFKSSTYHGRDRTLYEMYLQSAGRERKEECISISKNIKYNETSENGIKHVISHSESFKIYVSLPIADDTFQEYIVDSGCNFTYLPFF